LIILLITMLLGLVLGRSTNKTLQVVCEVVGTEIHWLSSLVLIVLEGILSKLALILNECLAVVTLGHLIRIASFSV
jgi:hypothetical protein